eukprot:Pgem_evm1s6810
MGFRSTVEPLKHGNISSYSCINYNNEVVRVRNKEEYKAKYFKMKSYCYNVEMWRQKCENQQPLKSFRFNENYNCTNIKLECQQK